MITSNSTNSIDVIGIGKRAPNYGVVFTAKKWIADPSIPEELQNQFVNGSFRWRRNIDINDPTLFERFSYQNERGSGSLIREISTGRVVIGSWEALQKENEEEYVGEM